MWFLAFFAVGMFFCPISLGTFLEDIMEDYSFGKTNCECGYTGKSRLVGGRETERNEYPFIASVEKPWKPASKRQFCGGTLITPWHVLTAAHCADDTALQVRVGAHNLTNSGRTYRVSKILTHDRFNASRGVYDIALIVTESRIEFDSKVGPACLPNRLLHLEGQRIKAIGWGDVDNNGRRSPVLQEVDLGVVSSAACIQAWRKEEFHPRADINICTYAPGRDTCTGDSGGPLVWFDPEISRYTVAGVVSYGGLCAGKLPGVATDVSAFLGWINANVAASKSGVTVCHKI